MELSAILSTFVELPFVIKIFVLSILSGRFTYVLLYKHDIDMERHMNGVSQAGRLGGLLLCAYWMHTCTVYYNRKVIVRALIPYEQPCIIVSSNQMDTSVSKQSPIKGSIYQSEKFIIVWFKEGL